MKANSQSHNVPGASCSGPFDAGDDVVDACLAAGGDLPAFERLVRRHHDAVVHAAACLLGDYQDALEAAQETFLKAFRSLHRFRNQASFRTWIHRIAINTARSLRSRRLAKKRGQGRVRSLDAGTRGSGRQIEIPDERFSPEGLCLRREVKEAIESAIGSLESGARKIIVLRDIAGAPYESIARVLGLPIGTVKSRVHRARLLLRERLRVSN